MADRAFNLAKNKSNDRILVLEKIEGEKTLSSKGIVDNSLFNGENKLHAIIDTQTMLWHLKYENGIIPPSFKQQFTSWTKLMNFVTEYYRRRNIRIAKVID
ncbi:MAG: hypothetical protein KGI25_08040 [Thaumarchaeota archaeon]|nr:hypothetical protein [Nitrososphaerota archaeon]